MPRTRVLWVEDKTKLELAYLVPPVLLDGRYDLEVAHDATEAVKRLTENQRYFQVLIFDLDLPPGEWEVFQTFYRQHERAQQEPE